MLSTFTDWVYNSLTKIPGESLGKSDLEFNEEIRRKLKNYNNTIVYSQKVGGTKMDVEIGGKTVKTIETTALPPGDNAEKAQTSEVTITDERGDVKTHDNEEVFAENRQITIPVILPKTKDDIKRTTAAAKVPLGKTLSKIEMTNTEKIIYDRQMLEKDRVTSSKHDSEIIDESAELLDVSMPFRMVGQRSSHTNLKDLMEQCPMPQPPLTQRHLKTLQLNEDQALIMAEQVGKMKSGMERLQEIVKKFNCAERYKQDIDFLVENIGPAIAKFEEERAAKMACEKQNEQLDK